MMTFEQFTERIKNEIGDYLSEESISDICMEKVNKNNGVEYTGMIIISPYINISPTIYLDNYYQDYLNGRPLQNILSDIADTYKENKPLTSFDISSVTDFEKAKENIFCTLVNYDANKELLKDVPFTKVEDLARLYRINVVFNNITEDDLGTILLRNNIFENYGISVEELDAIAIENTKRMFPPEFMSMQDLLVNHMAEELMNAFDVEMDEAVELAKNRFRNVFDMQMHVLTNNKNMYGAVHILDPDVMDMVAEKLGEKYYVLPSSLHEVIVLPYDGEADGYIELEQIVHEVNENALLVDEYLSDKVYMVDAKNHNFFLAEHMHEYEKEQELQEEKKKLQEIEEQEQKKPIPGIKPFPAPKM